MRIAFVIGTRPEIIKMHPIVRYCQGRGLDFLIIHTGQHYSPSLSDTFLGQLEYPSIRYNLNVRSGTHAQETGMAMIGIERVLKKEEPDIVLVEGDTNTVLAGALASTKLGMEVGHVEAGLRSFDKRMPEETNRILTDHSSSYHFAPTETSKSNLLNEGLDRSHIFVTGNTIVDAVYEYLDGAVTSKKNTPPLKRHDTSYCLVTFHRQENVDDKARFVGIIKGLKAVEKHFKIPILYPVHPRARKHLKKLGLNRSGIRMIEPVSFFKFIELERRANLIITDSGGIQEEACILKVPCVTVRDSTERPETIEVGSNILSRAHPGDILAKAKVMINRKRRWPNPFGDGKSAERIIKILEQRL